MTEPVKTIVRPYSPDSAAFGADRIYNHGDATGFIRLHALRLRIRALAGKRGPA